jgi:predicted MFS family arabinose efflux permease
MTMSHPDDRIPDPKTLRALLTRDFVLGFLAFSGFAIALFALIPTLPIFLVRLGTREAEIGVIVGVYGAASLVARLLVGGALSRYSEKAVLMAGALLFGLTFLALIVFRPFWPLVMVRILQGVSFAALDTAVLAFVVSATPLRQRTRAIGYFMLAPPVAQALAPAFGMFLLNYFGFVVLFLTCTGLCACTFLFAWMLRARQAAPTEPSATPQRSRFLDWRVIPPAIPSFLHGIVWGSVMAFLPLYALENRITNPGLYFSAVGTMLIAGRMFGGKVLETISKEKILISCLFVLMVSMVVLSASSTLFMLAVVGLIWGTGGAFFFPTAMAYVLERTGSSDGITVGTFRAVSDFGIAIGPTIVGVVLPHTGYHLMFLFLAAVFLASLCYFYVYSKRTQRTVATAA